MTEATIFTLKTHKLAETAMVYECKPLGNIRVGDD